MSITYTATAHELREFAARWPCFGEVKTDLTATFADNGDLADIDGDEGLDDSGVLAVLDDMKSGAIGSPVFPDNFGAETYAGESIELETLDGFTVTATIYNDDDATPPWEREDGHGEVTEWTGRDKEPGELVLCEDRGKRRFYDFAGAVKTAKRDGWGATGDDGMTKGAKAAFAARADFERLRRWAADQWRYVGVAVQVEKAGIKLTDQYGAALWGIESDCGDYITETANELVSEALDAAREAVRNITGA